MLNHTEKFSVLLISFVPSISALLWISSMIFRVISHWCDLRYQTIRNELLSVQTDDCNSNYIKIFLICHGDLPNLPTTWPVSLEWNLPNLRAPVISICRYSDRLKHQYHFYLIGSCPVHTNPSTFLVRNFEFFTNSLRLFSRLNCINAMTRPCILVLFPQLRESNDVLLIEEDAEVYPMGEWNLDRIDQRNLPLDGARPVYLGRVKDTFRYLFNFVFISFCPPLCSPHLFPLKEKKLVYLTQVFFLFLLLLLLLSLFLLSLLHIFLLSLLHIFLCIVLLSYLPFSSSYFLFMLLFAVSLFLLFLFLLRFYVFHISLFIVIVI